MVKARAIKEILMLNMMRLATAVIILSFFIILYLLAVEGLKVMSIPFLIEMPRAGMTEGGIMPALLGTFYLTSGAIIIAFPLSVLTAVYMTEYAEMQSRIMQAVRIAVNTLAGVPSVVYGLFGFAVFVKVFGFGVSILAGSLTLAVSLLPILIRATEEALYAVPNSFREASFAVGASKWQTIYKVVLPSAAPGILTGTILSISKAAGDTAPIMFTAVTFFTIALPDSIFSEVMALPYHIYGLMTEGAFPEKQTPIAYGTSLVLILLVLVMSSIAVIMRVYMRRKRKW
jgi:phosphate transport system permease protein